MKKLGITLIALWLASLYSTAAVAIVQPPSADAIVRSSSEKRNFGFDPVLELKSSTFSGVSEAYLKFDLPQSTPFSDKVILRVFGQLSAAGTAQLVVRSIADADWAEDTLTWRSRPEHRTTLGNLQVVGISGAWYELDVTEFVKAEAASSKKTVTFAIVPGEGAKHTVVLQSRQAESHRPELFFSRPLFAAKVIFCPRSAQPPPGYVADHGQVYGPRNKGLFYGWSADNSAWVRDRMDAKYQKGKNPPKSPERRYDFMAYMDNEKMTNRVTWEIGVPNATYRVRVVAGDSLKYDSIFGITAESVVAVQGVPEAGNKRWIEGTVTVPVTDGRLTIGNSPSSSNNKICFVEVNEVETALVKAAAP